MENDVEFTRYAIFYSPPATGDWAAFATSWLGWNLETGREVPHPACLTDPAWTATPRKYGLHATLTPPFHLRGGVTQADLITACADLAAQESPVVLGPLELTRMGRFLALGPNRPCAEMDRLAAACVRGLDRFREAPSEDELNRRRAAGLNSLQEQNLSRWGYPYVMEAFRFHITLTGRVPKGQLPEVEAILKTQLVPLLPSSLSVSDIALVGEGEDDRFRLIERFPLSK